MKKLGFTLNLTPQPYQDLHGLFEGKVYGTLHLTAGHNPCIFNADDADALQLMFRMIAVLEEWRRADPISEHMSEIVMRLEHLVDQWNAAYRVDDLVPFTYG